MWELISEIIILLCLALPGTCGKYTRWQRCNVDICYGCFSNQAHCKTNSSMRTVPQDMVETLTYLDITYTADNDSGGCLYQADVRRYRSLESIHLFGNFSSIDVSALATLSNLSWFHLESTLIRFLPVDLLVHNKKFTKLQLIFNQFTEIPLNIFTGDSARNVISITFHGHKNATLPCLNNKLTLPAQFYQFSVLEYLNIGYNRFRNTSCSSEISEAFFAPVSNITDLSVEGTNFLYGRETALKRLNKLKYLDISFLSPYRACPAKAKALFENIPASVKNLDITYWETGNELKEDCLITNKTVLAGLSRLKLQRLKFGYSDGIFGPTLKRSTIPPIPTLNYLDMSYCRMNSIKKDVISDYPNISELILAGNPLGPNDINFVSNRVANLNSLTLQRTNIRSDMYLYYDASNLICNFPNTVTIDFSTNYLRRLPRFNGSATCTNTNSTVVERIFASNNRIEEFVQRNASGTDNICKKFPNLKELALDKNIIRDLYGLEQCHGLEKLNVYQNHLQYGSRSTDGLTGILQQLSHITWLSLGFNGFQDINSSLLYNMPNLTSFYFAKNNIQYLDEEFFSQNLMLQSVDLSNNYLQNVHKNLFENLRSLGLLDLRGNSISVFTPDFLCMLDKYKDLGFFGFGNNPYDCGCNRIYFQKWVKSHPYFTGSGVNYIKCDSPPTLRGTKVIDYENDPFECTIKGILIVCGSLLAGLLVTLLIALPCYKYRWYVRHAKLVWSAFRGTMETIQLETMCPYDAFVSYDPRCEDDCMWVANELIRAIEGDGQFKLYLEHRDAIAGTNRYTEREIALKKSKRILIVVSNSYLNSADCLSEADLSGLQMHGTEFYQKNRVMLLLTRELSEEIIRPPMTSLLLGKTLKVLTKAVEYNQGRKAIMWRKIRTFLSKPLYTHERRGQSPTERSVDLVEVSTESTPLLQ